MAEAAVQEETKMCSTCERAIEVSKIRMHEIGCARSNYKCRECGDVVAKADREEHEETAHKPVKCQFCPHTAPAAKFGSHEENCDMRPKQCQYCEQEFRIEVWVDHVEACGTKTTKCEQCQHFIQKKHWADHQTTNECQVFAEQTRQKELQEQQKRLDELERFRMEEENQRKKAQEKRDARERENQAQQAKIDRDRQAMQSMSSQAQQVPSRGPRAASGSNKMPGVPASGTGVRQPGGVSATASRVSKPVINNTRSSRAKPTEEAKQPMIPGRGAGAQRTTTNTQRAPVISNSRVANPVAQPKPAPRQPPRASAAAMGGQADAYMDEDAINAAAIAAALDEDEGLAMAEKLQNEAYTGGNLSARGGGAAAEGNDNLMAQMQQQQQEPDDFGVRAPQAQVMDQLIGGMPEPMQVDEYQARPRRQVAQPPPDMFGAGAQNNFPSGFQDSQWGRAAGAGAGSDAAVNLGGTTSQADLERAIAASYQENVRQGGGADMDEDAQLAAILEASKHDM